VNLQRGLRTIKAAIHVILPADAMDPNIVRASNISTRWIEQSCSMDIFLGKATFSLEYTLDNWNTVSNRPINKSHFHEASCSKFQHLLRGVF
jgi:hypothetical protein